MKREAPIVVECCIPDSVNYVDGLYDSDSVLSGLTDRRATSEYSTVSVHKLLGIGGII